MILAEGSHTQIRRCRCGTVQVQIGPTCMTMDRRVAQELLETLAQGLSALASQELAEAHGYSAVHVPAERVAN
ncbi:MAG: hypothetical protein ACI9VR_003115 [Cognaticolwellia sp.]|jgi:hypothetical protein